MLKYLSDKLTFDLHAILNFWFIIASISIKPG